MNDRRKKRQGQKTHIGTKKVVGIPEKKSEGDIYDM
jgi:hypothetical protein